MDINELVGKKIIDVSGLYEDSKCVTIKTNDGNYQFKNEKYEDVKLTNWGKFSTKETIISVKQEDSESFDSLDIDDDLFEYTKTYHTWTVVTIKTLNNTFYLRWIGQSDNVYGEESPTFEQVFSGV